MLCPIQNKEVVKMNNTKQKLICVVGESCSGKDTIIRQSMAYMTISKSKIRLKPIVSYATRPIRENETNGVEHWFISEEEAKKITGENELLAYTYIKDPNVPDKGYEYFTTLSQLGDCNLYIIDPRGLSSLMKYVNAGKIELCIIFISCPKMIRDHRARKGMMMLKHINQDVLMNIISSIYLGELSKLVVILIYTLLTQHLFLVVDKGT